MTTSSKLVAERVVVNNLIEAICDEFNIPEYSLRKSNPTRHVLLAKKKLLYLVSVQTDMTLTQIGHRFGLCHTTVLWHIRSYAEKTNLIVPTRFRGIGKVPATHVAPLLSKPLYEP